jgi:rubrerythrin
MKPEDIKDALKTLAKMAELEIAIAKFYEACGQKWDDESQIWVNLSAMEIQHARIIKKVADALKGKPSEFNEVRFINVTSIEAIIERIEYRTGRIKEGLLPKKDAIYIAQGIESSLLEFLLAGMFESNKITYRNLISGIIAETREHKSYFDKMMSEIKTNVAANEPVTETKTEKEEDKEKS